MTLEQLPFPTGSWHHLGFPSIRDTLPRVEGSEKQLEFNSLQAEWICSNQKLSENPPQWALGGLKKDQAKP